MHGSLPVQGFEWLPHSLTCTKCPVQLAPLYFGTGLLHLLVRLTKPLPHETGHSDHDPHLLQFPGTRNEINDKNILTLQKMAIN
jgi:hypothetical protein